jgi:hypothetical protein
VTPEIVTETYSAYISPTWTSFPFTEPIVKYFKVTPEIETEKIPEAKTVTKTRMVNGRVETYTTLEITTHYTFVVETPVIELETYLKTQRVRGGSF